MHNTIHFNICFLEYSWIIRLNMCVLYNTYGPDDIRLADSDEKSVCRSITDLVIGMQGARDFHKYFICFAADRTYTIHLK